MNRVTAETAPMQKPADSRRTVTRLLLAAWLSWGLSIASIPSLAFLFASFIKPDPTDDFGMGPLLSGAILGVFVSIVLSATALLLYGKARRVHPAKGTLQSIVEWVALLLPLAMVLLLATGFMGTLLTLGVPVVVIGIGVVAYALSRP
jgi:hypothetical protein